VTLAAEKVSILLVDDTPANLLAMEATLEWLGEDLVRAYSGREAMEKVESQEFAAVLMDVQMPVMDGFEAASRIREREAANPETRRTPIIFVTAAELTESHLHRAYAEGAVDFIRKPYVPEILRSKVKVFVDLYRNTIQLRDSIAERMRVEEEVRSLNAQLERRVADRTAELARALEQAEANELRYRTLAEAMPQIVWTATTDGAIDYFNSRWSAFTGIPSEEAFGWKWLKTIHPDDSFALEQRWQHAVRTGESFEGEARFLSALNGEFCWNLGRAEPIRSHDGHIIRWLGTFTDIETQKRAEAILQEANMTLGEARDRALEASRAKSLFLANMSHELRTPLNAIMGYAEIIEEELPEEAGGAREDVRRIVLAGQHLLALINDVLDLAKIEAGKMELTLSSFALEPVVHQVVSSVSPLAEQRQNQLKVHCEDGCGNLHADELKVRQILLNLLSNACKFTENGMIELRVRRFSQEADEWLEMEVRDSGIGISEAQLPKLFKEFSQADPSPTRNYGGTGLGLAICRRFAEMMGGSIDVLSEEGRGSAFTVRLPAFVQESVVPLRQVAS